MNSNTGLRKVAIAAAMLAASSAATISLAQDKVTIRIAHLFTGSNTQTDTYKRAMDEWEAANPNVNLVREATGGDDHRLKLATDLAANNVPDVFYNWSAPADVGKFVDAGVALDISEYLAKSKTLTLDSWAPDALKAVSVDGKPYMLPTVGVKCFTLYNTSLFDQYKQVPPKNWDELLAVSKVFSDAGIAPIDTGSKGGNPGHFLYNAVLSAMPDGQADAEAAIETYNVATPAFRSAAHLIHELIEAKAFPADSIANGDWGPSIALYNQGKAAMLYTCPWMLAQIEPSIAAVTELMYFPTLKGAAMEGSSYNIGNINNGWMINQASFHDPKKQDIIVSLMDALQSDQVKKETIEMGYFPGWKAGDLSGYKLDPLPAKVGTFTATSPNTYRGLYTFMPTAGSLTAYLEAMDKLFAGDDPDAVIDAFQSTLDREKP